MPRDYPHLRSLVFDQPLAIAPAKLNDILHVLGPRLDLSHVPVSAQAGESQTFLDEDAVDASLAIIPIHGTLVNRGTFLDAASGLVSYEILRRQLQIALSDDNYEGIVLDVESFGGEAAGMVDLSNDIREADEIKPVYAIVNANAMSAAYGLASAARSVIAIRSALVGSVGVIAAHRDESKHNEQEGYDWTLITAGDRKADFSPTKPLSDEALAKVRSLVDKTYDEFVALVATNRELSERAVRDTEAAIYSAEDAVTIGLVDDIMPAEDALESIMNEVIDMRKNRNGLSSRAEQPGSGDAAADDVKQTQMPKATAGDSQSPTVKSGEITPEVQAKIDEAVESARAEERESATKAHSETARQIREACETLHRPELASGFIEQGLSLDEARAKLLDNVAAASERTAINTSHDSAAPALDEVEAAAQSLLKHKSGGRHGEL